MFMQDRKSRRKPLVYGKVKRPVHTYDIFDLEDAPSDGPQARASLRHDGTQLGQQQIQGQVVKPIEKLPTPKGTLRSVRQHGASRQKPLHSTTIAEKESRIKDGRDQRAQEFDFSLSDEEDSSVLFEKSMQKRRRLTPVRNGASNIKTCQRQSSSSNTEESREHFQARPAVSPIAREKATPMSWTRHRSPESTGTHSTAEDDFHVNVSLSTPKQTRLLSNLLDSGGPLDSPSNLRLTSLSLENQDRSDSERVESSSKTIRKIKPAQARLVQPRKRLIDAMVSPQKRLSMSASSKSSSEDLTSAVTESLPQDVRRELKPVTVARTNAMDGTGKVGEIISNGSSTSSNGFPKPRITYSRERSHLADMIDDLFDPVNESVSQEDSLTSSQNTAIFSSFGSVTSHKASEEDFDQETAGIRSIHELRQAGGKARSLVDIESILEDIESEGRSARSRRLLGLVQLTKRLADPEVARHILEQSLDQRLSRCPVMDGDVVGQTLLAITLSSLATSIQLPITLLKGAFEALMAPAKNLLQETRELGFIARDRKQNLSRATSKDIAGLVEHFCSSRVWPNRRPKTLTPRLVFIRFLDIVFRQLRQLGDFETTLPTPIFNELVQVLLRIDPPQLIAENHDNPMLVMELTVSVIESFTISRNWAEDGCLEVAKKLSGLGPMLAELAQSSTMDSDRTHHLILRLILNITNNDSDLCEAFAEPKLLSSIFGIIKNDFLQTRILANATLKESKLEGVILAFGTMSNLAEHSSLFRRRMLDILVDGRSMVDWIAFAFHDQVELASEVC